MTEAERYVVLHALGLTPRGRKGRLGCRWAYRNYFAASEGDVYVWEGLVERGLAKTLRHINPETCGYPGYAVTFAGARAAGVANYVPSNVISRGPLP